MRRLGHSRRQSVLPGDVDEHVVLLLLLARSFILEVTEGFILGVVEAHDDWRSRSSLLDHEELPHRQSTVVLDPHVSSSFHWTRFWWVETEAVLSGATFQEEAGCTVILFSVGDLGRFL
jgi:hypothetical protein